MSEPIELLVADHAHHGTLVVPAAPCGLVVSPRGSPGDQVVAAALQRLGIATLQLDLRTPEEAAHEQLDATFRVDIGELAERLIGAIDSIVARGVHRDLPIGICGCGEGGAAALIAAARRPMNVAAIACRGARLELAAAELAAIRVPTMLIVGSGDLHGMRIHREAARAMVRAPELVIIPGANERFEQPGALDEVAAKAAAWFADRFCSTPDRAATA